MEVEQPQLEVIKSALKLDTDSQDKELNEDENFNFDKTIEVENSSLKAVLSELVEVNSTNETVSENGKRKAKEEKPPSKIVVRRLPPTMTKDQFLEQVSPLPDVDYMYYVQGNVIDSINPFSRAYLNFVNQDDLFSFSNTFDNYVFLDSKGQEYPAVVEFNMVQRFPKQRNKKKDPLAGTIESDPAWIAFKENLLAEALENSKTQSGKATKQHFFETEISTTEEVNTTPLLEFLKVRRAEKARIREERREEKKRKEIERKLKQKTKDKKEGEEEEAPKEVKIHHKQSEKQEKEYNKIIKKCGEDKLEREEKTESIKQIINPTKKILILKAGSEGVDQIQKKSDISNSEQNLIVESGKCDIISPSTNLVKQVNTNKVKEAEQQTMFLRKLLGLLPTADKNTSKDNEVSAKSNDQLKTSSDDSCRNSKVRERLSAKEPPEEVLSAFKGYLSVNQKKELYWSKENINPGLPSASFRASGGKRESGESEPGSLEKQDKPRLLSSPQLSQPNREEVLTSKDRRDQKERERGPKKKDEKEKVKEPRVREFKSRGGKSYQEERLKLAERREEKKREMQNSGDKKQDQVDSSDMTESTINESKSNEEKITKIEKKRYERKGRYDNEEWKEEKKRMRNEKNAGKRDGRDRREEYSRRQSDRKNSDLDLRRKGKNYKNSDSNKADKRKGRDQDSQESNISSQQDKPQEQAVKRRSRSFDDLNLISDGNASQGVTSKDDSPNKKRSNSLENQRSDKGIIDVEKIIIQKKEKNHSRDYSKQSENSSSSRSRKDRSKTESKVAFSKTKERVGEKDDKDDTNKNKNLDGSCDIDSKVSNKAPTRSDRRIRNKDRPSIEIYRPGMGKFSKQRLEKEKALGSSTEVDSPSHSPSPTPKSKLIS